MRAIPEFVLAGYAEEIDENAEPARRVLVERQHEQLAGRAAPAARRRAARCLRTRRVPARARSVVQPAVDERVRDRPVHHAAREARACRARTPGAPSCRSDPQRIRPPVLARAPTSLGPPRFVLEARPCRRRSSSVSRGRCASSAAIRPRLSNGLSGGSGAAPPAGGRGTRSRDSSKADAAEARRACVGQRARRRPPREARSRAATRPERPSPRAAAPNTRRSSAVDRVRPRVRAAARDGADRRAPATRAATVAMRAS